MPSYAEDGWAAQGRAVWRQSLYTGQVAQALCVQAQAEHLRRGRDTPAQTGGSLFWQLNSEWPGASKSSLQYDGGWKALHHFAARFYAPFRLSAWLSEGYSTAILGLGRIVALCYRSSNLYQIH
jgi:beta-galactosidase/beta-glucuronidase